MRRTVVAVIAIAICTIALLGCDSEDSSSGLRAEQSEAIDRLLERQKAAHGIPGLAVAVIRNGAVVKRVTLGVANVESGAPVSADTPFQLSSTTKSFSATAVLLLVGDGSLRLDDNVGSLLDGLPASWRPVTVRQLLSHTSGLPDITRRAGQLDLIADSWERAFPMIESAPMQFAPGERWAYTQTNYVLLALIVKRVSGLDLEEFMAERLFGPLEMKQTFFAAGGEASRTRAVNYEPSPGSAPVVRALDFPPYVHAAGGLCASLEDMIRWNAALDSGRALKPELAKAMWTAVPLNGGSPYRIDGKTIGYGLGWVVDAAPGHRSVGHSGGNSTAYRRFVDEGFTIIVLHNGVLDPDGIVASIAAIVRSPKGSDGSSPQTRLWDASITGETAEITRALNEGAEIDALDTRKSPNGRRALNWAAQYNRAEAVRLLLARGATIDAENKSGFTALHHAAEAGSLEAAELLLAAGANPTHPNRAGERPAETARRLGHDDVAAKIADAGGK